MKLSPKMRQALKLLANGDPLGRTRIGRPTKQRLAKHGFASFRWYATGAPKDWDGPMEITQVGRDAIRQQKGGD